EALTNANVADEIARMRHGLDTHLGEGAALISGGQAQRISLARAFLSGRKILLLDEPTSQVDIESESRIIDAVAALGRDWTIVMITHRASLLRIADSVYELTDGRLVQMEHAK
ncbi:MAG: ATP-binding cassette domain-containing protein, partial [Actinomycetales bacterium]|nr:ATP-binding cassette domain-containing protein [Actinomycetales bacterium]